uniref:Uncharacterized protein n=1 Tax=uncultured Planctomycetota bacterium TaxID=120965 RepID=A0A5B8KBY5_9BACT|nr:hypothetical protein fos2004AM_00029 [uncultured Planctomycetota bacterium]
MSPGGDGFDNVAAEANPAVRNQRDLGRRGARENGRDLGDAGTGDDPGGADCPRTDADLDRIRSGRDQVLDTLGRGDVPRDYVDPVLLAEMFNGLDNGVAVAVGGIDHDYVRVGGNKLGGPLVVVYANGRADPQPAAVVRAALRELT